MKLFFLSLIVIISFSCKVNNNTVNHKYSFEEKIITKENYNQFIDSLKDEMLSGIPKSIETKKHYNPHRRKLKLKMTNCSKPLNLHFAKPGMLPPCCLPDLT